MARRATDKRLAGIDRRTFIKGAGAAGIAGLVLDRISGDTDE